MKFSDDTKRKRHHFGLSGSYNIVCAQLNLYRIIYY